MNFKTFLVGGAVRDKMLGIKPKDLDFVILAPTFNEMKETLLSQGAKIHIEKPQFQTILVNHPTLGNADFALGRKDSDKGDGRRPEETFITQDIREDLARRDFSINAMAEDVESGEIIDLFNGKRDLINKTLTFVGDASKRLSEDKLRAFRLVRLMVQKGFFADIPAQDAVKKLSMGDFESVSTDRIKEELDQMFKVNSIDSFRLLFLEFPILGDVASSRGIWFKPTNKHK